MSLQIETPSGREVVLTRHFDAPARLVFDALTKPELIRRWYGPDGWSMETCEVDLRVGGAWRFVSIQPEGRKIGQKGVYKEIELGKKLVNTESWEDWDPGETLVTTVLTEQDGKTIFVATILFPSEEVRDFVLKSGIESSAGGMYDKLAEVLACYQP
jgi:uncharacterized protein YndB with AHSA1/START domain